MFFPGGVAFGDSLILKMSADHKGFGLVPQPLVGVFHLL
jgi:hypothetical protein